MRSSGLVASAPVAGRDPPCSGKAQASIRSALAGLKGGEPTVFLSNADLGDAGVAALLKGLAEGKFSLKVLNLTCNGITDSGAIRLAEALAGQASLETLVLAQNAIGDEGASRLAKAMDVHPRLRILAMEGNRVGDPGASALLTALASRRVAGAVVSLAANPVQRLTGPALDNLEAAATTVRSLAGVGVTLRQLLPLYNQCIDEGLVDPWKTTTGEFIRNIVLPRTAKTGTSFVAAESSKTGPPMTHVIHAWTGLFQDLLKCIAMHASKFAEPSLKLEDYALEASMPQDKVYFVDGFCCNQHSATNRLRSFGLSDSSAFPVGDARCQIDKLDLVAEQIRRRGGGVLVAVDSKQCVLSRLACLSEMRTAILDGLPMEANFISIQEAHGSLTDRAEACSEKARHELLEVAQVGPGGLEGFNRDIVDFINAQVAIKWQKKVSGKRN